MKKVNLIFIMFTVFFLYSCNDGKKIDIKVDDVDLIFNASMYRGAKPDIKFDELCEIVGEPNEYLDEGSGDDVEHSPIYYFPEGKIICHWGGSKRKDIGMVDYIPFENKPMYLQEIFKAPISNYGITEETKKVRLYEGDMLYYIVYLEDYRVTKINYWLVKKKMFNVAS